MKRFYLAFLLGAAVPAPVLATPVSAVFTDSQVAGGIDFFRDPYETNLVVDSFSNKNFAYYADHPNLVRSAQVDIAVTFERTTSINYVESDQGYQFPGQCLFIKGPVANFGNHTINFGDEGCVYASPADGPQSLSYFAKDTAYDSFVLNKGDDDLSRLFQGIYFFQFLNYTFDFEGYNAVGERSGLLSYVATITLDVPEPDMAVLFGLAALPVLARRRAIGSGSNG